MSDFLADGARTVVTQKLTSIFSGKPEFGSVEDIMKLYVKKGQNTAGINNLLPDDVPNVDEQEQFPLVFLEQVLRPDGKGLNLTEFPLPRVLQCKLLCGFRFSTFRLRTLGFGLGLVLLRLLL